MMNERQQKIQKYQLQTLLIVIVLGVMLIMIARYIDRMNIASRQSEHVLGYPSRIGAVGVEVFYDINPVDVVLISPSGQEYDRSHAMLYYINYDAKVITMKVSTQETGEWKIRFANGLNTKLSFRMLNQSSDTLYVDNVSIVTDDGPIPKLAFLPIYGEPTDAPELGYTIIIKQGNDFSFPVASGTVYGNENCAVELDIPDICYTGSTYYLTLAVTTKDDFPQTVTVNQDLYLMKRETDSVSDNDIEETENETHN